MPARPFFYKQSHGIRVTVRPVYLSGQSRPSDGHFMFAYFVRLENIGDSAARLRSRRWLIHDSIGEDREVKGEGVGGEQPLLLPGRVHEYQSFCVLKSPHGYMEGEYFFSRDDHTGFAVEIPRFILQAEGAAPAP
jgi:ApaG protein